VGCSKLEVWIVAAIAGCLGSGCAEDAGARRCEGDRACDALPGDAGGAGGAGGRVGESGGVDAGSTDAAPDDLDDIALSVRFEDTDGMALDVVTVACAGDCVDVAAVVRGGNPPYTLEWDDGSSAAIRRVCADESHELSVRVTDTALQVEEFSREARTITASIAARVFECSDAGACEPGPGSDTPLSGRYEGTGTYVCDNDMSAESALLINHLALALDLNIDENREEQGGQAYIQWGLVLIAGLGELSGSLECGGALKASLVDALWGLPGPEPMTLIPTGTVTGEFTARASDDPEVITGSWVWMSMLPTGQYGNTCNGTYEARRMP